nr:phosphotransferase family protein [Blastococcus saxobsidens]
MHVALISGGRSNLTYGVTDGASRWVVRRPPVSGLTPSAHDMVREWRVTSALQGTAVPVPRAVALCEDPSVLGAPFTVVEHVDGLVVRDRADLSALSDDDVRAVVHSLVRTLADLHAVDPGSVGLASFGRPHGFLGRQVELWLAQWQRVGTQDLPGVAELHRRLSQRLPASDRAAIVHGDYRIDNTILDAGQPAVVRAVIDWELSTLGDPFTDVALMCVYRHPSFDLVLGQEAAWASPRMPSADDLAEAYARASGQDLPDWPFYLGLAYLKLAVISEGIAFRAQQGSDAGGGSSAAGATPALVEAGLAALG